MAVCRLTRPESSSGYWNASKGPAVQANGAAQADRVLYRKAIRSSLERQAEICACFSKRSTTLLVQGGPGGRGSSHNPGSDSTPACVVPDDRNLPERGWSMVGLERARGQGPRPAIRPSIRLGAPPDRTWVCPRGRLKDGETPPRLDGRTIDFSRTERQPRRFRFRSPVFLVHGIRPTNIPRRLPCWITHTKCPDPSDHPRQSGSLADVLRGVIEGIGPRYCPSIEDKSASGSRARDSHQIFLEPEGAFRPASSTRTAFSTFAFRSTVQVGSGAQHLRAGAGACAQTRVRNRVRLLRPAFHFIRRCRTRAISKTCFSPGRSTERPDTRRRRAQGLLAGLNAGPAGHSAGKPGIRERDQAIHRSVDR